MGVMLPVSYADDRMKRRWHGDTRSAAGRERVGSSPLFLQGAKPLRTRFAIEVGVSRPGRVAENRTWVRSQACAQRAR
jgi:hypothetical protein